VSDALVSEQMNRNWRDIDIRTAATLISLLLSVWHIFVSPAPNTDAFDYVRTAEIYLEQGTAAAFQWYPGSTYPVLMGMLNQLSGVNLILAGQLINSILFALLVYGFITLVLEVRNTPRVALIAAIVILAFPTLNEYRYYLIRDFGFLALMLLSAVHLTRYGKTNSARHGFTFIVCTLLAALFRAEALVYLPLAPLALLSIRGETPRGNLRALLNIEATLLVFALAGGTALSILGMDVIGVLQRMAAVYLPFLTNSVEAMSAENSPLAVAIFGEYAANFSGEYLWIFMIAGMSAILVIKLIGGFGAPIILLFLYGFKQIHQEFRDPALRVTLAYVLISFGILLAFLALTRFLSERYTLLFCLTLLPMLVLAIDRFIEPLQRSPQRKLLRGAFGFLILFSIVDAHISFSGSRSSLDQAVEWLNANTKQGDSVFTNSNYVAYFSGRVVDYDKVNRYINSQDISNTPSGTIVVLTSSSSRDAEIAKNFAQQQIELVTAFPDQEDPELVIYRRIGD